MNGLLSEHIGHAQVMRDLKTLAIAFQPPDSCTAAERELLTVSSAKASLTWRAKQQQAQSAQKQVPL